MTTAEQATYMALDALGVRIAVERAVAAERARCAAVCREVAAQAVGPLALDAGVRRGATTCAEAIERGAVER